MASCDCVCIRFTVSRISDVRFLFVEYLKSPKDFDYKYNRQLLLNLIYKIYFLSFLFVKHDVKSGCKSENGILLNRYS